MRKPLTPDADLTDLPSGKKKTVTRRAKHEDVIPLHRLPVVCPPDRAGQSLPFRLLGYLCRILVVWLASAGLALFISSAMTYDAEGGPLFLFTLTVVCLIGLWFFHPVGKLLAPIGAVGMALGQWHLDPDFPASVGYGFVALYNGMLERLYDAGFLGYVQYSVPTPEGFSEVALETAGMCAVGAIIAVIFGVSLLKRVHAVPPAILTTTLLVVILGFNLYSNQKGSNPGVALVIVSLATLLVMAAYDRLYRGNDSRRFDTRVNLFDDSDRPVVPPTPKKPPKEATPEAKTAFRAARADYRRDLHRQRAYDRRTRQAYAAMGGFASAAVMLLCLLVAALPTMTIHSNFTTVDVIDEKVAYIRDYVTAVLQGDGEALDELSYAADEDNFLPHSTELEQLSFTEAQIFWVGSNYGKANVYLRGWLGTDYVDGAWLAADEETLATYRALFGTSASPGDDLRHRFYQTVAPSLVDAGDTLPDDDLTQALRHTEYGFVTQLVNLRRINSPDSHLYLPVYPDLRYGVLSFNSTEKTKLTYVNYFDGIYTGRAFEENGAAQATVSYTPLMTEHGWAENQARLIAAYHLQREALLARMGYTISENGQTVESEITLQVQHLEGGTTRFTYRLGADEWRTVHRTNEVTQTNNGWKVTTEAGTLTYVLNRKGYITDVSLSGCRNEQGEDLLYLYEKASDAATRKALAEAVTTECLYSDFVYDTYTQVGNSLYLSELAQTILAQAHTLTPVRVWEEDDPNTPDVDESLQLSVYYPAADVSSATLRASSTSDAYTQRDLLVRNVIDYLISDMGCTYTLTPDLSTVDPSLDGVENFLQNTRQGYCVQFASAVALLLREMGIPARYAEGYIASDLTRNVSGEGGDYGTYVTDSDAHAWVEVYFDGIGWVTYETTPAYYTAMYGRAGIGGALTPEQDPVSPRPQDPETQPLPDVDTEVATEIETDNLPPKETDIDHNPTAAAITKGGLIGLGILIALVAIILFLRSLGVHARYAEEQRQTAALRVSQNGFDTHLNHQEQRELARTLTDGVTNLLTFYGMAPLTGEFREDYADRLSLLCQQWETTASTPPAPDWHRVTEAVAAEEFGHGMTPDQMKAVADGYRYLRHGLHQRISLPRRLYLRYVKRLI